VKLIYRDGIYKNPVKTIGYNKNLKCYINNCFSFSVCKGSANILLRSEKEAIRSPLVIPA